MAVDHDRIDSFLRQRKSRMDIAQVVRGAGFKITWVLDEWDERLWGLYLKPNKTLLQLFGTTREVLLWTAEFSDFQARTIQQAQDIIRKEHPRLSDEYCIIFAPDREAEEKVAEVASNLASDYVGIPLHRVTEFKPFGTTSFLAHLQSKLFSRDLYRVSTPLTHPRGFYGRKTLIGEISAVLSRGLSNVGVFGLRKMGKTSLLYRLLESLRASGRVFVCHLDLQRLDSLNPTANYTLWSIGEALIDSNTRLRKLSGLKLFGHHSLYSEVKDNAVLELFDHDIRYILANTPQGIVLLLDEIELMSPSVPGARWGNSFVVLWRLLRGLHQQLPGRLAYLITGTNPRCIEMNRLQEMENPAYNYFDVKYLPALTYTEAQDLLSSIGVRMGLEWSMGASKLAFRLSGGHPFLLRGLASVVHRLMLPRDHHQPVDEAQVFDALPRFLVEFNPNLSQMVDVLRDDYPSEFYLLETLAAGQVGEFREMAEAFPEDVAHLDGYGLLDPDLQNPRISVEVLQSWLQRRKRTAEKAHQRPAVDQLSPGDLIDRYEVIAAIGHTGGFAQVYKAHSREGASNREVAIKLFRSGLLSNLQREMDAVKSITHPNIVSFMEHGRTEEGWLYLVMEYLPGQSLKTRVDRASRVRAGEAAEILSALAQALVALHPDEELIETLRSKNELSPGELEELEHARHGFVHRDIKPENILLVKGRGPVLIDFNISSEVGKPVRTLKHTPGYIPPEGFPARWNAQIDLYALGITMLQATTGIEYTGDNINDLRSMANEELPAPLRDIIFKLCDPTQSLRFRSAKELSTAVEALGVHT